MKRDPIDQAAIAQYERLNNLLLAVKSLRGATWRQLFALDYRIPTIKNAIRQGYLREHARHHYVLTAGGRRYLDMGRYRSAR
jgi:hypothetical protein